MRNKIFMLTFLGILLLSPLVFSFSSNSTSTSEWKMFGRTLDNNRYYPDTVNMSHFGLLWSYEADDSFDSSPAISQGILYIGNLDKNVYALNATTGNMIWNYTLSHATESSPAISQGKVYIGCYGHTMYVLNATIGTQLWNYTIKGYIRSSFVILDDILYFGDYDYGNNSVYALNTSTGTQLWNYTIGDSMFSSPSIYNDRIYIASENNMTFALNATTGIQLWNYTTQGYIHSSPAISGGILYIGSYDNKVYALNATNGILIWNYTTGYSVLSSPAISQGILYIGSYDNKVYALNATNGEELWTYVAEGSLLPSPAISQNILFIGSHSNKTYVLNVTTGILLWNYTTGNIILSSPSIANGIVYIGGHDNKLYAFSALPNLPPSITQNYPPNNLFTSTRNITFNFTATDDFDSSLTCNLTIDGKVNQSGLTVINSTPHATYATGNLSLGTHTWNITCWDNDNAHNTSETRTFTVENCNPPTEGDWNIYNQNVTCFNRNISLNGNLYISGSSILTFNNTNLLILPWDGEFVVNDSTQVNIYNSNITSSIDPYDHNDYYTNFKGTSSNYIENSFIDFLLLEENTNTNISILSSYNIGYGGNASGYLFNSTISRSTELRVNPIIDFINSSLNNLTIEIYGDTSIIFNNIYQENNIIDSFSSTNQKIKFNFSNSYVNKLCIRTSSDNNISIILSNVSIYSAEFGGYNSMYTIINSTIEDTLWVLTQAYSDVQNSNILNLDSYGDSIINFTKLTNLTRFYSFKAGHPIIAGNVNIISNIIPSLVNANVTRLYPLYLYNSSSSNLYNSSVSIINSNTIIWNSTLSGGYVEINLTFNSTNYNNTYNITLPNDKIIGVISLLTNTPINITFDQNAPNLTINSPIDNYNSSANSISFNFTATDDFHDILLCNLTINGTVNLSNIIAAGGAPQINTTSLNTGTYYWNISCWDEGNKVNISITRTLTIDTTFPTTCTNITLIADTDNDGNIEINWSTDSDAGKYGIFRAATNSSSISSAARLINITGNFFEDNTSLHNTEYWYAVTVIDSAGNENLSIFSNSSNMINAAANDTINPKLPSSITVTNASNTATIRWPAVLYDIEGNADFTGLTYEIWYKAPGSINISRNMTANIFQEITNTDVSANSTEFSIPSSCGSSCNYMFIVITKDDANNRNLSTPLNELNIANVSLSYSSGSSTPPPSSSGGGGGGGIIRVKQNIFSKGWADVEDSLNITIDNSFIPLTYVSFHLKEKVSNLQFTVETLGSHPEHLPELRNLAYSFLKITARNVVDDNLIYPTVKFKVKNSWLSENKLNKGDVALFRYKNNKWHKLKTEFDSQGGDYSYYWSEIPGFSYFVIASSTILTAAKTGSPTSQDTQPRTEDQERGEQDFPDITKIQEDKINFLKIIFISLGIILSLAVISLSAYFIFSKLGEKRLDMLIDSEKQVPKKLLEYIKLELSKNIPKETIKKALFSKGWPEKQVEQAFQKCQKPLC